MPVSREHIWREKAAAAEGRDGRGAPSKPEAPKRCLMSKPPLRKPPKMPKRKKPKGAKTTDIDLTRIAQVQRGVYCGMVIYMQNPGL